MVCQLRDAFYEVEERVKDASRWKAAITEEPYDVKFLTAMRAEMDVRHELWKYFEVSTLAIQEWKATYFKKVGFKRYSYCELVICL